MKYQNMITSFFLILFISISAYTQQDSKIFWVDQSFDKIQSASLNGSYITDVVTGLDNPERIAIDTTSGPMKLYFTETGGTRVARCNFNGSNLENIVTGIDNPEDLELDLVNRKVYWLTDVYSTDKIQRADMDSLNSNVETIFTNNYAMHGFHGIGVDPVHQWIFWTQAVYGGLDRVNRINYDGTGKTTLGNYLSPRDLELVGNTIYFIWGAEDLIMRANLDGSGVDTVLTGVHGHYFAIDTALGQIYWTEPNKIKCANLDNSNHLEVIDGLGYTVKGIAIYYNPLTDLSSPSKEIPDGFYLAQNYPNPFNPTTTIEFTLAQAKFVTLTIYNIIGKEVATLVSERLAAGKYRFDWSPTDGSVSGVYLYRIQAGEYADMKKMILLK